MIIYILDILYLNKEFNFSIPRRVTLSKLCIHFFLNSLNVKSGIILSLLKMPWEDKMRLNYANLLKPGESFHSALPLLYLLLEGSLPAKTYSGPSSNCQYSLQPKAGIGMGHGSMKIEKQKRKDTR